MSKIAKLRTIIEDNLAEMKLVSLETGEHEVEPYVDEMVKKTQTVDKTAFVNIETFNIFLIYFYLSNNNVITFEEALKMCEEIRDNINRWNYNKDYNTLVTLADGISPNGMIVDPKVYDCMARLGITPEFVNYNLKTVYIVLISFLKLRRDISNINMLGIKDLSVKKNMMRKIYKDNQMQVFINIAKETVDNANTQNENRKSIAEEKTKYTLEVLPLVEDESILKLTTMPAEWHRYLEINLLEELYDIIIGNLYRQNKKIDATILLQEGMINKTPLTKYLYSQGIDPKSLDKDLYNKLEELSSTKDIIVIIEFLKSLGLTLYSILTSYSNLVINLDEEKIDRVNFFINSHAISPETLFHNLSLLDERYNELLTNYSILKPVMDFENIFYNDQVLLKRPTEIKNMLTILSEYELTRNNYVFLLCHFNYLPYYDLMLEHEISPYLFISICETESPLNTIKRIIIYKEIGEEYATPTMLLRKEVASEERCMIPDESLDDYMANCVPDIMFNSISGNKITTVKKSSVVKNFDDNYKITDTCYLIGGAVISRPKFLRNFEAVGEDTSKIIPCLISDSIISEKEYLELVKEIKGLSK